MTRKRAPKRAQPIHEDAPTADSKNKLELVVVPSEDRTALGEIGGNCQAEAVEVASKPSPDVDEMVENKGTMKGKAKKAKKVKKAKGEGKDERSVAEKKNGMVDGGAQIALATIPAVVETEITPAPKVEAAVDKPEMEETATESESQAPAIEQTATPKEVIMGQQPQEEEVKPATTQVEQNPNEYMVADTALAAKTSSDAQEPVQADTAPANQPALAKEQLPGNTPSKPTRSPLGSPSRPKMHAESSIEAFDALQEAIEEIGKALPKLESNKPPRHATVAKFKDANGPPSKKPATTRPVDLIVTKAKPHYSVATIKKAAPKSAARPLQQQQQQPKPSKTTKPPPPPPSSQPRLSAHGRSLSVRVRKTADNTLAAKSTLANAHLSLTTATGSVPAHKPRPRPVSMHFPAPAPTPKSTKPLTKPTFTLPGEAIALKLKAQREERKEREEVAAAAAAAVKAQIRTATKPRPVTVSSSAKPAISTAVVRATATSRAREGLMAAKNGASAPAPSSAKRTSVALGPSTSSPPKRTSSTPAAAAQIANASASATAKASLKRRAVFQRDRLEQTERERERKAKEEAARKARVEAAERGRAAGREWAERRRVKSLRVKATKGEAVVGGGGGEDC